jgi:glutamate N-acetyltransferase/amino-acid N-acetyltransferase
MVSSDSSEFIIGGIAKGSGMIHPNLATLLCFVTTDASVDVDFLRQVLPVVMDVSFNMVSIDGDTSPNDMVLLLANGQAGNPHITRNSPLANLFRRALAQVCIQLAKGIARDGEGASRLIEVTVTGAASKADASVAARTVVGSLLVKASVHGGDPNWGRIIAAAGRSGAAVDESKIGLFIGDTCIIRDGHQEPFNEAAVVATLRRSEVPVSLHLNLGEYTATAWGCDLSAEYVTINSEYRT